MKKISSYAFDRQNYWCIDKTLYQLLGASTVILLMEYISLWDKFKHKKFYRSRAKIEQATGITRTVQFRIEQKLKEIKLLKTKTIRTPASKTYFKLSNSKIKKLFKDPIKYFQAYSDKSENKENHVSLCNVAETKETDHVAKMQHGHVAKTQRLKDIKNKQDKKNKLSSKEERTNSCSGEQEACPDRKIKKLKIDKQDIILSKKLNLVHSNHSLTTEDFLAYNELVKAGATNHRKDTKAYSFALTSIHQLLSRRCTNPYNKTLQINQDKSLSTYSDKEWTVEELVDVFKFCMRSTLGKYKSIGNFINCSFGTARPHSPLVIFHKKMLQEKQRYEFNGTAKKIMNFVEKSTGKSTEYAPGLYIRTGELVDKISKKYSGNPNLLPPENQIDFQFIQYLKEKMNRETFKVPYMCSENFLNDFITTFKNRGILIDNNRLNSFHQ